jgi:addiction module HigA family antidote
MQGRVLGVTRQALNNLVSGRAAISAEMTIRLEKAFGGGAENWLRTQVTHDLAQAEKRAGAIKVQRVKDPVMPA